MATQRTPKKAAPSPAPSTESPMTKKDSRVAVSCPAVLCLQAKRENVLSELNEVVPQLPVEFFLTDNGILPPLNPGSGVTVQKTIKRLKEMKNLVLCGDSGDIFWRWRAFPQNPSVSDDKENDVFRGVELVADAISTASESKVNPTLRFLCNPDRIPIATTRDNNTRPDCYGVLLNSATTTTTDEHRKPYWINVGVPGEFKKSTSEDVQNWTQNLWSLNYIMQEDPRRRFVFAFTIEDTMMRIWFASRSDVLVSLPFDFVKQYEHTVDFFLRLMYANEEQLGWDTTIEREERGSTSEPFRYRIKCSSATYRTVRMISELGAEALRGRGTRVWEVRKINEDGSEDKQPLVLKDSWVDSGRRREHVILQRIRKDAKDRGLLEGFERHFMKVRGGSDVYIGKQRDHTHSLILRKRSPSKHTTGPLSVPKKINQAPRPRAYITAPEPDSESSAPRSAPLGAAQKPKDPVQKILQYEPKVHYRIVFEELGCTVAEMPSLSRSLKGLADALEGLKILHQCGWVHRDISTGNILIVNGIGKLSDLEYAKREDDSKRHGIRTGTPDFISSEVDVQGYLYLPDLEETEVPPATLDDALAAIDGTETGDTGDSSTPAGHQSAAGASSRAKAKKPYDPTEFRHNPLHDLESMMWLGGWLLVCSDYEQPPIITSEANWVAFLTRQTESAFDLFGNHANRFEVMPGGTKRLKRSFEGWPIPHIALIGVELESFRKQLFRRYLAAAAERFAADTQPPFATMAGNLHDVLLQSLNKAVRYLNANKNDLPINIRGRTSNPAPAKPRQPAASATSAASTSAAASTSGKRGSDSSRVDPGRRASKRQKLTRAPHNGPPIAEPSVKSRSLVERRKQV